jgi:SAM-dependent methyltransferase
MINFLKKIKKIFIIYHYVLFVIEYLKLNKQTKTTKSRFSLKWKDRKLMLKDKYSITGFDRHYIYHLAWATRILKKIMPDLHYDFSSSLYFSSQISAFIPVKFFDFHAVSLNLNNLTVGTANLTDLAFKDNSVLSLSCMHVIEHIGLGRYGDTIDYDGDLKAINELKRVLAANGNLLFVVPVGASRIIFNAHRIYSYNQIIELFSDLLLVEASLITDDPEQGIIENATAEIFNQQKYGCGCFWFKRKL